MKYNLELFYFEECPYCQLVLAKIKDLKIKLDYLNTRTNPEAKKRLQTDTGRSTVPCLYINGKPMFESKDIANWLGKNVNDLPKVE